MKSTGKIIYSETGLLYKLEIEIDSDLLRFMLSLVPRFCYPVPKSRISLIKEEKPIGKMDSFHGKEIEFDYYPSVYQNNLFWWTRVDPQSLYKFRIDLGLSPICKYNLPPDSSQYFYFKIANCI